MWQTMNSVQPICSKTDQLLPAMNQFTGIIRNRLPRKPVSGFVQAFPERGIPHRAGGRVSANGWRVPYDREPGIWREQSAEARPRRGVPGRRKPAYSSGAVEIMKK